MVNQRRSAIAVWGWSRWQLAWLIVLLCISIGCGDSLSRRKQKIAELRKLSATFGSKPSDLTPLNKIVDVLEHGAYDFDRVYACGELRKLGPLAKPALPALVRALNCGNLVVEREAPLALGAMGKDAADAVPDLIANLRKDNRDAGWFSADALGQIGEPAIVAIPDLEVAAKSQWELMKDSANRALAKLRKFPSPAHEPQD